MEPVNDMRAISACDAIHGPLNDLSVTFLEFDQESTHSFSSPESTDKTPGGNTCCASSTNFRAESGARGEGLTTTQFPVTSAGANFQIRSDNGKLNFKYLL